MEIDGQKNIGMKTREKEGSPRSSWKDGARIAMEKRIFEGDWVNRNHKQLFKNCKNKVDFVNVLSQGSYVICDFKSP